MDNAHKIRKGFILQIEQVETFRGTQYALEFENTGISEAAVIGMLDTWLANYKRQFQNDMSNNSLQWDVSPEDE